MKRKTLFLAMFLAATGWALSACSDDDSGHNPVCGDGQCEEGETAEGCPADCGCGNGIVNQGEECDGTDLNDNTCKSLGYQDGTLICTADCKLDVSQCEGQSPCGNGVIDPGEECDGENVNGETCISQGFNAGSLDCTDACHFNTDGCCSNDCDTVGQTQCSGDTIQTCTAGDNGCLMWTATDDCSTQSLTCGMVDGEAQCVAGCQDECDTDGAQRCNGNAVETCSTGQSGCLEWTAGENCDDTSTTCVEDSGTASCMDQGSPGDTCADPIVIPSLPYTIDGTDITADFSNDYDWSDNQGCDTGYGANGPDAVFSIQLSSGQTIRIEETGGMDAVLRVFDTCDASAQCLTAVDTGDATLFTAPADGTYFITMESWSANPASTDYNLSVVEVLPEADCSDGVDNDYDGDTDCADSDCNGIAPCENPEATCGDGIDNDGDGDTDCFDSDCNGVAPCEDPEATCGDGIDNDADGDIDCADSDCNGIAPCEDTEVTCDDSIDNDGDGDTDCADSDCFGQSGCTTETICDDNEDNDGDNLVDCDDPDCSADPGCAPIQAVYQAFGDDDPIDLGSHHLQFVPDSNDPMGYQWTATSDGSPFPVTVGSGSATQTLTLSDDAQVQYQFTQMTSFPFFGQDYSALYVVSNGFVTFVSPNSTLDYGLGEFLAEVPKIAGIDRDLSPQNGGTITVDEFSDQVAITFEAVPRYSHDDQTVTFQILLHSDGTIDIYYGDITLASNSAYAGITSGVGVVVPDETDFVPPPPPVINEVLYDNDGQDDAEFIELFGIPGTDLSNYTLIHYNGSNGDIVREMSLSGYSIASSGFFIIGASAYSPDVTWTDLGLPSSNVLQNGPDSLVLYDNWDGTNGTIVDAVEWGTGANNSYAETAAASGTAYGSWNTSIGRHPDGQDTNDNSADFVVAWWATPGEPNTQAQPDSTYLRLTASSQSAQAGNFPIDIPDNNATGISVVMDPSTYSWFNVTNIIDIQVGIRIRHTYIGDLTVTLTAPDGSTSVGLHEESGSSNDDIEGVYDLTLTPDNGFMNDFNGLDAKGPWTLHISDGASDDTGSLLEWVIWVK